MEGGGEGWVAQCCRATKEVTTEEVTPAPLQGSGLRWEHEDGSMKRRGQTPRGMKGCSSQSWKQGMRQDETL